MAGVSDSQDPDDLRFHLDQILAVDDLRATAPENESDAAARRRQSIRLPAPLRARVSAALVELSEAVPGISAAETQKLLTTRDARDALREGREALARVDSHLASTTSKRNPLIGRNYGVYGKNPETFGGVLRALAQAQNENARVNALPETDANRALAFTPVVADAVSEAHTHLTAQLGERFRTRGDLSRQVKVKASTLAEARECISAVRNHLYANLPGRKRDRDLIDYGFRPLAARRSSSSDDEGGDIVEEAEVEVNAGGVTEAA